MGRILTVDDITMVYPTCYGCQAPPPAPKPPCEPFVSPTGDTSPDFLTIAISYEGYARTFELMTGVVRHVTFSGAQLLLKGADGAFAPPEGTFSIMGAVESCRPTYIWDATGTASIENSPCTPLYEADVLSALEEFAFADYLTKFKVLIPVAPDFTLELITSVDLGITAGGASWCEESFSEDQPYGHVSYGEFKGTLTLGEPL